ncbi:MAG: metal-dependent transcriptional regulator [Gammaproteobacteria bacterium]|nr:MAG: metal-dependent transcriptional regulator [Gammaproteobacteria bacterium]
MSIDEIELSENLEDYLEVIYQLETTEKVARAKDIAANLGIKPGSVTGGLKTLDKKGLINYQPYAYITLTDAGKEIAKEITRRHQILSMFLKDILQIEPETADATACRIEHVIDKDTLQKLCYFVDFMALEKVGDKTYLDLFKKFCAQKQPS